MGGCDPFVKQRLTYDLLRSDEMEGEVLRVPLGGHSGAGGPVVARSRVGSY